MKSLLLILSLVLSLNSYAAQNAKVVLNTNNSVLFDETVSLASTTRAMLELADLVIKRGMRNYPIYLVLDSPGGGISSGNNFIQFAKTISNLHTITIFGASMASAIAQSLPGNRYITEHGQMMFHRAYISMEGQVSEGEFESRLRLIKQIVGNLEIQNAKRIGMSLPAYKEKVKDEWWLTASEAVTHKTADLIVDIHCTPALIKKKVTRTKRSFFGSVKIVRSACPLIN